MTIAASMYRPLMFRSSRARPRPSLPVFAVALSWLLLTAMLPLTVESDRADAAPLAVAQTEADWEAQRERLQLFSEALLWPFGLAPANAQAADAIVRDSASKPANCS